MKGLKRVLALALVICTLLGMVIVADVSANSNSDKQLSYKAIPMSNEMLQSAGLNVSEYSGKTVKLVFKDNVEIDIAKVRAHFTLVRRTDGTTVGNADYASTCLSGFNLAIWEGAIEKITEGAQSYYIVKLLTTNLSALAAFDTADVNRELVVRLVDKASDDPVSFNSSNVWYATQLANMKNGVMDGISINGTPMPKQFECIWTAQSWGGNDNTRDAIDLRIGATVEDVTITGSNNLQVKFSEPVKINIGGTNFFAGLRVIKNGLLYSGATYQMWTANNNIIAVDDTDSDGYAQTWSFKVASGITNDYSQSIATWAGLKYFSDAVSQTDAEICFSIQEDSTCTKGNGYIECVTTKGGYTLLNEGPGAVYNTNASENYGYSITDNNYFHTSVENVTITGDRILEVEFADAVKLDTNNTFYGLRILKDGKLYNGGANQMYTIAGNGDVAPKNPDSDGYAKVWTLKVTSGANAAQTIAQWAHTQYFTTNLYKDSAYSLCFGIQESGAQIKGNGIIECVATKDGKLLLNEGPGAVYDVNTSENYGFKLSEEYFHTSVENVTITGANTIQVEFEDAVNIDVSNNRFVGLCVMKNGTLYNGDWSYAMGKSAITPVNAVNGYAKVWNITLTSYSSGGQTIADWASQKYFRDAVYLDPDAYLCFAVRDSGFVKGNGFIECVTTANGKVLKNEGVGAVYDTSIDEHYGYVIDNLPEVYSSLSAEKVNDRTFVINCDSLYHGISGNNIQLRAYKADNSYEYSWNIALGRNFNNKIVGTIQEANGVNTYNAIVSFLNEKYGDGNFDLEMVAVDTEVNGYYVWDKGTAYPAYGNKILRANNNYSTASEDVAVIEYTNAAAGSKTVSVENISFEGTNTIKVEFTEPVKVNTGNIDCIGLRVIKDGKLYNGDWHYQMWSSAVAPISPDSDGYAKVWQVDVAFSPEISIKEWAAQYYFNDACSENYELCFSISEKNNGVNIMGNGLVEPVSTKEGKLLLNNEGPGAIYDSSINEHFAIPVRNNSALYTDVNDLVESVEVINNKYITVTTKAATSVAAGQKLYLCAYNGNSVVEVNGAPAQWEVPLNEATDSTYIRGTISEALGADTYSEITALLQGKTYELKLVALDATVNGAYTWYNGSVVKADITGTEDIVSLPEVKVSSKVNASVTNISFVNNTTIEIEFSEPVNVNIGDGFIGLRVINNDVLYNGGAYQCYQTQWTPVGGGTYATKWQITVHQNMQNFALTKYFRDNVSKTADLCVVFEEGASKAIDGVIDLVTTPDGRMLKNTSNYVSGRESCRISVKDNEFFYASVINSAELVGESNIFFTSSPVYGTGGLTFALRAYNESGLLKSWPVSITRATGSAEKITGTIGKAYGTDKYSEITEMLNAQYGDNYELILVAYDSNVNGACEYLTLWNGKVTKASVQYSSSTEDVAIIPFTETDKEIVSITAVDILSDDAQTGNKSVLITFSHDIDIAHMNSSGGGIFLTTSAEGVNDFIDVNGDIGNANTGWAPAKSVRLNSLSAYGSSANMVIGEVDKASYDALVAETARLNETYSASKNKEYIVRLRIEIPSANSGQYDLNYNIKPVNSNVYSPVLNQAWGANSGRIWSNVKDGNAIKIGSAVITSENTVDVIFVDGMGERVEVVESENFDTYTAGVRITDKNNELIYWTNTDTNGNAVSQIDHPQFLGEFTKKANDPYTWTLTINGYNSEGVNLYDMFAASEGSAEIGGSDEYKLYFAVEDSSKNAAGAVIGQAKGYIDNFVTTTDGLGVLKVQNSHQSYRTYFPLTVGDEVNANAVTVEKIVIEDEDTLKVTFSEAVTVDSNMWTSLRLIDENDSILYLDKEGNLTANSWAIVNGEKENYTPIQWGGRFTDSGDGKTWYLTITDVNFGLGGLSEIVEYYNANWKSYGAKLAFGMVSVGKPHYNGVVEGVVGKESGRSLVSNISYPAFTGVQVYENGVAVTSKILPPDAFYFVLGAQLDVLDTDNPITMTAKQVDEHNILITFSEAVKLNGTNKPYVGLRMVNENDYVLIADRDENGNTYLNRSTGKYMQWAAESYKMVSGTEMLVTFADTLNISDILSKSYMPEGLDDYEIKICIEESVTKDGVTDEKCVAGNGKVWSVVSARNPVKQLKATAKTSPATWDGAYASFKAIANKNPITVKGNEAKITGENELTFTWSESVEGLNGANCYAGIRYVSKDGKALYFYDPENEALTFDTEHINDNGEVVSHIALQWGGELTAANKKSTQYTFAIRPSTTHFNVYNLAELIEPAANSEWGKIMAMADGELMLCIEEKGANYNAGCIDSFFGENSKMITASPMIGNWNDGIYMDITGKLIKGTLDVAEVRAVSDTDVIVYFNAPVNVISGPYAAIRVYDEESDSLLYYNDITEKFTTEAHKTNEKGQKLYTDAKGNITTVKEGNTWVSNIAMQWTGAYRYTDDTKTAIRYTLQGREGAPVNNITDIMAYDWEEIGAYYMFTLEENGEDMVVNDGHINNIVRKDNKNIALNGNFFPYDRDNARFELIKAYTPNKITSSAEVISDTQIRVSFSEPVWVNDSFMAVRMFDNNTGKLMWSGEEGTSVAFQWPGAWEYEDDSQTSIIWTMSGSGIWGANNLYELLNYKDALEQFKDEGYLRFVIEEKATENAPVGYRNELTEAVMSLNGTNHMIANASTGYDSTQYDLGDALSGEVVRVESVTAIDDQTLEIKFNQGVIFKEGDEAVSMAIRYISESGAVEPLFDGRNYAIFNGDWEYADEEKTTVYWTLNTSLADSITDILTYAGMFEWNKSARTAFVIVDENEEYYCPHYSMRINGVTDLDGLHHLEANYINEEVMMLQMDITAGYELPETEELTTGEKVTMYVTHYTPYIIIASVLAALIIVIAIIIGKNKKRTH